MSQLRQGFGLVPFIRFKEQTISDDGDIDSESPALVRISHESNSPVIIGRVELLRSFRRACDGDDEMLKHYKDANKWGVRSLSRRLLKFSEFGMQVRGEHAIIKVNGINVFSMAKSIHECEGSGNGCAKGANDGKARQDEWITPPLKINAGDIISFQPVGGSDHIEFKVVSMNKGAEYEHGRMLTKILPVDDKRNSTKSGALRTTDGELSNHSDDVYPKDAFKPGQSHESGDTGSNQSGHVVSCSREQYLATTNISVDDCPRIGPEGNSFHVHFFPYGNGFSASRRQKLEHNFKLLGAKIVGNLWKANYIVISETIRSLEVVAKRLGVAESRLRRHLEENSDIRCVVPLWADYCINSAKCLNAPTRIHFWSYDPIINKISIAHNSVKRKRERNEPMDDFLSKKKGSKNDNDFSRTKSQKSFPRNVHAATAFKTLANLHQSMPLVSGDEWRAYSFRIVAGRLLELDFEVNSDDDTQKRLRSIKGFGNSVCNKIQECLNYGTITRINEFKSDKQRQAMKAMTDIWGVGPVKARELISLGYKTIDDVRDAINHNELSLERNQLAGVDCYEDILDRMPRSEVEEIGSMVRIVAERLFPGIETSIMGSYRREKHDCGDVDILLCHPNFIETIPITALGQIIDALWNEGKIAMHLTFLVGMTTGCHCTDYEKASQYVPEEAWRRTKIQSKRTQYDFYMGCLYSPVQPKVRRRVDIKFYPYRERAFATLYFTGNGYFNRSMRLWATRVFNYTLNDHGLFDRGDGTTRVLEASTEREIFNRLELVYRPPHERHYWDSLEPINKHLKADLTLNPTEFKEEKRHRWVE